MFISMGKIYCIIGKSSTGKDTIYKRLIEDEKLDLHRIVPYTTRPNREGEKEGVEYHYTDENTLQKYRDENMLVECRAYHTIYGIWYYYTVRDEQIDLSLYSYLVPGVLQSYCMTRDYFGADKVIPIYIKVEDGERLMRALSRERSQSVPKYEEMCRRFLADNQDFSEENLKKAGIKRTFYNNDLDQCIEEIESYIRETEHK